MPCPYFLSIRDLSSIPTIFQGWVFANKYILRFHKPAVGDVVALKPPPKAGKTQLFIKRIVGVSGDTIEVRNGNLYRNGVAVTGEGYVKKQPLYHSAIQNVPPVTIPPGHVFVMGDNRDRSMDSRAWGPVPVENIKGQVLARHKEDRTQNKVSGIPLTPIPAQAFPL